MERILIIDDDTELCAVLTEYLSSNQMKVYSRNNARDGLDAATSGRFDLIILDVMLPGMDGFTLLRSLRMSCDIGVLLLTARGEDADRITGFELGADDYLPKPFNPKELLVRIRAILRRGKQSMQTATLAGNYPKHLVVDGMVLNLGSRIMHYEGHKVELTDVEFELMVAFFESPGRVLSRESLVERVFDRSFHPDDRSLDMSVSRLRRKLDSDCSIGNRIKTVRSAGYLFSVNDRP